VIILSARGEEWDRVQGFEYGADDYVVKPFSMRELLMRIKAVQRRADGTLPGLVTPDAKVRIGAAHLDFAAYSLERKGTHVGLSRKELELLRFFLAHENKVLSREQILDQVWGPDDFPTTRTIDMHVLKLRKKLEEDPERPRHIHTVHGVGYRFHRAGEDAR
jgi:DNA-binding response OmpR family regulator